MNESLEHRLTTLEQQFTVLANEVNTVLGSMEQSMAGMAKVNKMAFEVIKADLDQARAQINGILGALAMESKK